MLALSEFNKKQIVLLFPKDGEKLAFKNDNLIIKNADGKIIFQNTCYLIFALFIVGNFTITTGLIQKAHKFCFSICLMTQNFRIYDVIGFEAEGNTVLRRQQYSLSQSDKVQLAKFFVHNKIQNQIDTLKLQRDRKDSVNFAISEINAILERSSNALAIDELMGYEGSAAKIYFKCNFNNCFWNGRKPRVKPDYINCTLDIGYTLLFNFIESLLKLYGYDLYVGFLHQEFYNRKSLVCDFVEPFRPLIDYQVRKSISLGQCREDHFIEFNGSFKLNIKHNKSYVLFLMSPLIKNKDKIFSFVQSYYRCFVRNLNICEFEPFLLKE